jgi:dipeptidase
LSIGSDWEIGSRDLEGFARTEEWWTGAKRIDVAAAYRNPFVPPHISSGRQRRAAELLEQSRGRHDVASFQRILRDHASGGAVWRGGDAQPAEERFFTLCAHSDPVHWTTASLVAPLPADRRAPWPVFVSFATPCTGIFLPVYVDGVIPALLARGGKGPEEDSAWWCFRRLQDAASRDPVRATPLLREGWRDLEERIETERTCVETEALEAALAGARDRACALVTDFMEHSARAAVGRARELCARIA